MAENKPGNGSDAPFGNGDGIVTGEAPKSGGNDFVEKPEGTTTASGGRDFSKESMDQKSDDDGCNPDSVPSGGPLPFSGAPQSVTSTPFRLKGG